MIRVAPPLDVLKQVTHVPEALQRGAGLRNDFGLLVILAFALGNVAARADTPSIEITELQRTATQSVHRVRIYTQEEPHRHAQHESDVTIESGGGTLYLNNRPTALKPGDHIYIGRNVPHYFVHQSTQPFTQARVIFKPPFDGKDRIAINPPKNTSFTARFARFFKRAVEIVSGAWVF